LLVKALVATPGELTSAQVIEDFAEAEPRRGDVVVVESLLVGLCGSDRELLHREEVGARHIVVGHEVLGRVLEVPAKSGFEPGDLVFGMIRRGCEAACPGCVVGRYDLCSSRPILERGLYNADGFARTLWTSDERFLVGIPKGLGDSGVLAEPLTSVVKAHSRMVAAVENTPVFKYGRLIVAGAGPIGLLAAWFLGRHFTVVDLVDTSLTQEARTAAGLLGNVAVHEEWSTVAGGADAAVDASGQPSAVHSTSEKLIQGGILILLGIYGSSSPSGFGQTLTNLVMADITAIASVNASREHHELAALSLPEAPPGFLQSLITREIRPEEWPEWSVSASRGIKTVVRFSH